MRTSRLLSILNTLQANSLVTASELAQACQVSLRTIYRDMDALSSAGIPVYSERGSEGGYRLLDGYRTRLNGLTPQEAQTLFLTGLTQSITDLGLDNIMQTAQNKLLSALPATLRMRAKHMHACFFLDTPAWFNQAEHLSMLPLIADAVWNQHPISITYQSWKQTTQQTVEPLGLVLKNGQWYLVAQIEDKARTYRIARISDPVVLTQTFERPAEFNLAHYWQHAIQQFEAKQYSNLATVHFSPWGMCMAQELLPAFMTRHMQLQGPPDQEGWQTVVLPVGNKTEACIELLKFGPHAEVLEPQELRAHFISIADQIQARYTSDQDETS